MKIVKKVIIYGSIAVFVLAGVFFVQHILYKNSLAEQKSDLSLKLAAVRAKFEGVVNANLQIINALASYIVVHPNLSADEYKDIAMTLTSFPNQIKNLGAAPNFKLTYIYPYEENRKIIGLDLSKIPDQWPQVRLARDSEKMAIAGPIKLFQGGRGLIGRAPVFIKKRDRKIFWGLVSSVIDYDLLEKKLDSIVSPMEIQLAIRGKDGQGAKGDLFYGPSFIFSDKTAVKMKIPLPNGYWEMAAVPVGGWISQYPGSDLIHFLGLFGAFISIVAVHYKIRKDEQVKDNEQWLRDVIYSSQDWVWEVDAQGRYLYTSDKVEEFLGYSPNEMYQKSPFDFMDPEELERVGKEFASLISLKQPIHDLENWNIHKNGSKICLLTNGVPILDQKGNLLGYRGVDKDITERKKWEAQLQLANQHVRQILESTTDAFFEVDNEFNLTYLNKRAEKQLGLSAKDIGSNLWELFPKAKGSTFYNEFYGALTKQQVVVFEDYYEPFQTWYEVHAYPTPASLSVYFHNITERKQLQKRLEASHGELDIIFSSIRDWIAVLDLKGLIVQCNPAFHANLGYPKSELLGRRAEDLIAKGDLNLYKDLIQKVADGENPDKIEIDFLTRNNQTRHIQMSIGLMPNQSSILISARDITDWAKIQTEIRETKDRLENIIDGTNVGTWEWNIQTGETVFNEKWAEIIGYTLDELQPVSIQTWMDFAHSEDLELSNELLQKHFCGESGYYSFEGRMRHKSGDWIWVLDRGKVMQWDQNGNPLLMFGTHLDITEKKQAEKELEESKALLDLFFSQSMDGFFFMMLDEPVDWSDDTDKEDTLDYVFKHQRITKINKAMLEQYRTTEDKFIGLTPTDFFQDNIEEGRSVWRQFFNEGKLHVDTREKRFDGTDMVVEGDYICIHDDQKRIKGHFGVQRDVTSEREAKIDLKRYIDIVDDYVIISQADLQGNITYASKAFCEISGFEPAELIGKNHNMVRHPDMLPALFKDLWDTLLRGESWRGEMKNRTKDNSFYWVDAYISPLVNSSGNIYGYMAVRQDITDKKRVEELSVTDRLTGLYNRMKIDRVLQDEQQRFDRYEIVFSVILFDIDHFKSVNDQHGHLVGDSVLKEMALLVKNNMRRNDLLGRWGGEEFLVICPHTDVNGAAALAEKLRSAIEKYNFDHVNRVTSSFGVASIRQTSHHEKLIQKADEALYEAKKSGRNCVRSVADETKT